MRKRVYKSLCASAIYNTMSPPFLLEINYIKEVCIPRSQKRTTKPTSLFSWEILIKNLGRFLSILSHLQKACGNSPVPYIDQRNGVLPNLPKIINSHFHK